MNTPHGQIISRIEAILKDEIALQIRYSALLEEEGSLVSKFRAEEISPLTERREALYAQILALQEQRLSLMKEIPGHDGKRLSQIVQDLCPPRDAQRIGAQIEKLRVLVQGNQRRGGEFSRVVNFALTIVNGSLSLLWSATQSVAKAYGRNRVVKEAYVPRSRAHSTLEEA